MLFVSATLCARYVFFVLAVLRRQATVYLCFQYMLALYILQHGHLLDSYLVEFIKTLALRHSFIDKNRIQVFHIAQTNQLIDGRIIAKSSGCASRHSFAVIPNNATLSTSASLA